MLQITPTLLKSRPQVSCQLPVHESGSPPYDAHRIALHCSHPKAVCTLPCSGSCRIGSLFCLGYLSAGTRLHIQPGLHSAHTPMSNYSHNWVCAAASGWVCPGLDVPSGCAAYLSCDNGTPSNNCAAVTVPDCDTGAATCLQYCTSCR